MVANILPAYPLPKGSIGQNSTFTEHGHVAYQIKWNHEMQQHGSKYFACRPIPQDPSVCSQNSTLSGHGHVAYQIDWNQFDMQHDDLPGRVAQSVTRLATDASLTADSGVASSIPARSHLSWRLIMK